MFFYIFFQIILLFLIVILKSLNFDTNTIKVLTTIPITLTLFFNTINKYKNLSQFMYIALFMAFLGDLAFLYYNNSLGILFFCLTALFYYLFLNKVRPRKITYFLIFISFIWCFMIPQKFIFILIPFYCFISLINLIKSLKLIIKKQLNILYFISFIYLAICDLNLFLIFLLKHYNVFTEFIDIIFIIEWTFYLFFQIILTSILQNKNKNQLIYSLT